jgi:hypothetical protein
MNYISTIGSDGTGTGTYENPYLTLQKCLIDGLENSIKIFPGTYEGTITINRSVTISSVDNENKALLNNITLNINSNDVIIDNLILQGLS